VIKNKGLNLIKNNTLSPSKSNYTYINNDVKIKNSILNPAPLPVSAPIDPELQKDICRVNCQKMSDIFDCECDSLCSYYGDCCELLSPECQF
jgi:hypothetical protein